MDLKVPSTQGAGIVEHLYLVVALYIEDRYSSRTVDEVIVKDDETPAPIGDVVVEEVVRGPDVGG